MPVVTGRKVALMDVHSSFKERVTVLGALTLVCLVPPFASAKTPARLPDRLAVRERILATAQVSAQNSLSREQQDQNSQPPPRPLTTERAVSKPVQITYEDGQLTIITENSPLSEVMSALRTAMGADIDLPPSVASQRIWVRLGPGPARSVLRELLDNTELDYVIQASATDPEGIGSVLLTVRPRNPVQGVPESRVARGTDRKNLPASSSPLEVPEQDNSTAESAAVSDAAAPAGSSSPSTGAQSAETQLPSAEVSEPNLSRPSGRTSEQMMQQLQSMYEQRRQMQMQQNQKPPSNNN
jgi:hypothetical protein